MLYVGMKQECPYNDDFKCKTSGVCIRSQYVCNGQNNCHDGSDEQNCGTVCDKQTLHNVRSYVNNYVFMYCSITPNLPL